MDCIDESTNTTTYLKIFQRADLLRWNEVVEPATRGWFLFGWPHTTAVIRDKTTNDLYAVDSWFLDNGLPATVVPLAIWKEGFRPGPIP
jgi:hypothetical protein